MSRPSTLQLYPRRSGTQRHSRSGLTRRAWRSGSRRWGRSGKRKGLKRNERRWTLYPPLDRRIRVVVARQARVDLVEDWDEVPPNGSWRVLIERNRDRHIRRTDPRDEIWSEEVVDMTGIEVEIVVGLGQEIDGGGRGRGSDIDSCNIRTDHDYETTETLKRTDASCTLKLSKQSDFSGKSRRRSSRHVIKSFSASLASVTSSSNSKPRQRKLPVEAWILKIRDDFIDRIDPLPRPPAQFYLCFLASVYGFESKKEDESPPPSLGPCKSPLLLHLRCHPPSSKIQARAPQLTPSSLPLHSHETTSTDPTMPRSCSRGDRCNTRSHRS